MKLGVTTFTLALLTLLAGPGRGRPEDGPPRDAKAAVKVGDTVPDFEVQTLDGKRIKLGALRKKGVVVLSFWCATCHSCRHVEHALAKLAKDHAGKAVVMAVDANTDDTAEVIAAFLKKNSLDLPAVLDPAGRAADLFGISKTTSTVVIDREGVLRYCGQFRSKDGGSAEEALKAVLGGKEVEVKTNPPRG